MSDFTERRPMFTNEELAEHYGRRTLAGMVSGATTSWVAEHARMAGSYARLALQDRAARGVVRLADHRRRVHPLLQEMVSLTRALYAVPSPKDQ